MIRIPGRLAILCCAAAVLGLAACSDTVRPTRISGDSGDAGYTATSTVAPEGQRRLYTRGPGGASAAAGVETNPFVWRAALDTLAFMPLLNADPYGGAIITDWYAPPETPQERFKVNALVQGRELRSDAVTVSVFRQVRSGDGWVEGPVADGTAVDLENIIIARARDLRQQQTGQ